MHIPARPRCDPPDFAAISKAVAAGQTLSEAWREYAKTATNPYQQGWFYVLFKQWRLNADQEPKSLEDRARDFASAQSCHRTGSPACSPSSWPAGSV